MVKLIKKQKSKEKEISVFNTFYKLRSVILYVYGFLQFKSNV